MPNVTFQIALTQTSNHWCLGFHNVPDILTFEQALILSLFFSLSETYEQKRQEHISNLQKKEEEMRQTFVIRVKEKESELKEAEKEVL